jgi:hypothetical protein
MKTKVLLMILALVIISFTSCKKDLASIETASLNLADDDAIGDVVFEDIFNTVDNATIIMENGLKSGELKSATIVTDSCPTITITHPGDAVWPKVITVDYGTGCTGFNNNTRAGKIITEVTKPRLQVGSKRTVTFVGYSFNNIKVEGTKVFENLGTNSNLNVVFSEKLTNGKLTLPNGKFIERAFERQREWTAGLLTKNIWDDECLITGVVQGKNIEGVSYTNTIITALHWKRVCAFLVSGVIKFERTGVDPIELNYGNGECDAKATVTKGGQTKEILLRNKHRSM